jgi:hypothetical protein
MLDALRRHYDTGGAARRYVVAEQVKSDGWWSARRTADFMAIDLWKTGRYEIHGHEIKVSRADWLRELKDPSKAAEFGEHVNRWWIVVPDPSIIRDGELPVSWGLMVLTEAGFTVARKAPRREALPLTPGRLSSLLRAVAKASYTLGYAEGLRYDVPAGAALGEDA